MQFVTRSLFKAYNVPGAKSKIKTFDTYSLEVPIMESEGEEISSSSEEEGQEEIKEEKLGSEVSGLGLIDNSQPLFDERRMLEQVDETKGITSQEFATVVQKEYTETYLDKDIAVIGFWKNTPKNILQCYHYFYVPNPLKRAIKQVGGIALYQLLYTGAQGEVFFFFSDPENKG